MCRGPASRGGREETVRTDPAAGQGGGRSALRPGQEAARVLAAPLAAPSGMVKPLVSVPTCPAGTAVCGDGTLKRSQCH